ncbi:MAG: acyltransferase family protein [Candidatus Hodarchaeota archaeon]
MKEENSLIENSIEIEKTSENFFQIDLLKTFMIAFVILDHAIAYSGFYGMGLELWERMSIPMFLIILGFNMGKSFARQGEKSLKDLYSINYFKKKFWRFIFPYLIFYFISTMIGFFLYENRAPYYFPRTFKDNWILEYIIFQKSLLQGPGNWFIPILFQSIILMPVLYKLFSKWPKLSLIMCFIIEIFMHLFLFLYNGPLTSPDDWQRELNFRYLIILYISAIGMGIWFSQDHNLFSKRNLFVWILFPISLIYMIAWDFFNFRLGTDVGTGIVRGDYNYLTFIYSALIFLIIIRLIPKNPKNKFAKVFSAIGKATFHIYLIQDLFYITLYIIYRPIWRPISFSGVVNILGIASNDFLINLALLILNWIIFISIGVIWWYLEKKVKNLVRNYYYN